MATVTNISGLQQASGSVSFESAQGVELHASIVRLGHHRVVFEIYTPAAVVRVSDVLANFRIVLGDAVAYSGRALVSKIINVGTMLICEAEIAEGGLRITPLNVSVHESGSLRDRFKDFL